MVEARQTVCSRCQRNPPLAPAPFCAACLLTPGDSDGLREPTGTHHRHLAPGTAVGPYEVVELLGEGGFAEVYSARHAPAGASAEGPPIALKIIKRGMDSRDILARFRAEQRTIQALSHPNVVALLNAGFTSEGLPYFAMAQVDGLPITDYCRAAQLSLPERLRLFLPLCDAVQYAHRKGVLHRDLKPPNILVEETADGPVPKVIDFGIAKALESGGSGETLVTQLGVVLGTPTYMSPEQAAAHDDADTRSDIYSLGAVLYEMLTDGPPFETKTLQRLRPGDWAWHLRENPPPLVSVRLQGNAELAAQSRCARRDLDQIVRQAMSPDVSARYATVDAFADDLRAWLGDRPVSARSPSVGELTKRCLVRYRWPVAVAVAVLGGIIATAGIGTILAIQARRAEGKALADRNRALAAETRAGDARERADHQNYQASVALAAIQLDRGEPYLAAAQLRATPAGLRGWEWGYLMASISPPEASADSGLKHPSLVAASSDGAVGAVASGATLAVINVRANRVLVRRTFAGNVLRAAVSADGQRVAAIETAGPDGVLHVSRVDGGDSWSVPLSGLSDLGWEPVATGGALLVVSGNAETPVTGRLARFDPATGRVLNERVITRFKVHPHSLAIGAHGHLAVAENSYKDLEVFSLPDLRFLSTQTHPEGNGADDFLLDDLHDRIVVARQSSVYAGPATRNEPKLVGELTLPNPVAPGGVPPQSATVRHLNWLPDGHWLAAGQGLGLVEGEAPRAWPDPGVEALASLTGGRAVALLRSGQVEIRPEVPPSAPPARAEVLLGGNRSEGRGTLFTSDSRWALFQPWQRNTLEFIPLDRAASTATPYPSAVFAPQPEAEWCELPALSPDGAPLVRSEGRLAAVYVKGDGFEQMPVPATEGAWSAAAFSDGHRLAVAVPIGVRLLDWKTGAVFREWPLPNGPFHVFVLDRGVFSKTPAVAALGRDATLHFLPLAGPPAALATPFRVNGTRPAPLAFHADPPLLAGALEGGGYAVYDLRSLPSTLLLRQRVAFAPTVTALAFTHHARRLAVATQEHRLTLWDWPQELPLLSFPIGSYCASVAFSPDGEWLAYTDYNPSLVLRRAEPRTPGR